MNKLIKSILSSKIIEYVILAIILIVGFLVRLYRINNPVADWHSWRQADTASVTRNYIKNGIDLFLPRFDDISSIQSGIFNPKGYRMVEFPFYNVTSVAIYKSLNFVSIEEASRLVTIFSALITGFFIYLVEKKYISIFGGLLAAAFYLFIPYNIYFTRVILPDPFGTMMAVASLWFFVKFIDDENNLNLIISGILLSIALLIKPFFIFYLTPTIYLLINKYSFKNIFKDKRLFKKLFYYSLIILVPFILWRIWEGLHPEGIPFYKWAFNGDGIRFRPAFWRWIFGERLDKLILGGWGVVLFAIGLLAPRKNNFINYFILGMFLYVSIVATANVRHDYYQIITIPAISLVLAAGSDFLINGKIFSKLMGFVILFFSVGMMLITGWGYIRDDYNINHPEIIEAGKKVDEITPRDSIVVANYNGDTAFLYQTNRRGWPAVDDSIDNIIKKGADYYVSVDLNSKDTLDFEKRFETLVKTDKYIILDLHKEFNNNSVSH